MSDPSPAASLQLILAHDEDAGFVAVDLEPFIAFNRWMNAELDTLEQQWADFQTPGAPPERRTARVRKPK